MYVIVSLVLIGSQPHVFTSTMHFETVAQCEAYKSDDQLDLLREIAGVYPGVAVQFEEAQCAVDPEPGEPA